MFSAWLYAQGDIVLERVADLDISDRLIEPVVADPDGTVVIGRGEESGHRHRFTTGAALFKAPALAADMPSALYVGHVRIDAESADLVHEEHATLSLPRGTYRVRRQREFEPGMVWRVVSD